MVAVRVLAQLVAVAVVRRLDRRRPPGDRYGYTRARTYAYAEQPWTDGTD